MDENKFKVKLVSSVNPQDFITFDVSPEISETRNVNYKAMDPIHLPGSVFAYEKTTARAFNVTAKLISRTIAEADKNQKRLQLLRSWTMPYFGNSTNGANREEIEFRKNKRNSKATNQSQIDARRDVNNTNPSGKNLLGAPPDVLYFSAYSNPEVIRQDDTSIGNLNRIPVFLAQLSNTYSADVEYIPTIDSKEPFPVIMNLEILLTETHSPAEFNRFSLSDFKAGKLPNF